MAKTNVNKVYVITLGPDMVLCRKIRNLKSEAKDLVGDQVFINDPPHLTLYIGYFDDFQEFNKELVSAAKKIKGHLKGGVVIDDWMVFKGDMITNKQTLACNIAKNAAKSLEKVQKEVVPIMKRYRKKMVSGRYSQVYDVLGNAEKKNIDKYGFPFVGRVWKPHISIASFDNPAFAKVWERFKNKCPKGKYCLDSLNVYILDEDNENITLLKKYHLR